MGVYDLLAMMDEAAREAEAELADGLDGPTLTLYSCGLLSKWGFNDGDTPEVLTDYWDELGIAYPDWRNALRTLVRKYLLPALAEHHSIEVVEIETIHNPIRASMVDGIDVGECWYGDRDEPRLTPESVDVPYEAIATACGLALTSENADR